MMQNNDLISRKALMESLCSVSAPTPDESYIVEKCINKVNDAPKIEAVALPCKIGQRVWAIRNFRGVKHAESGIVNEMFFTDQMKLQIVVKYVSRGEWGKTVFATSDEAEAALAKMDRKDDT
jgi:hypothetical protein